MIQVTCAILIHKGKILAAQRSERMPLPLKWEFPGGKIEAHETPEACLQREIKEELGIEICLKEKLVPHEHHYDHLSINLIPYLAEITSGVIVLKEHKSYRFLNQSELLPLDWAAADLPIVHQLLKREL
tara:strand:+ start:9504 stop:9890 length:387 start_codon:yes stop_codon:yes gene_type:complete